jgi:acyl-CoA thioesterase I
MKATIAGLLVGLCVCVSPLAGRAQVNHVNIMPFGDSVTAFGSAPESSYRYWLWHDLQDAGFNNIDFVGHSSGVGDGAPANTDFDQSYEGSGDNWTSLSAANDARNAAHLAPDIVLLDFGSNDFGEPWETADLSATRTNLDQTIETIRATRPDAIILIAKPTRWATSDPSAKKFMSELSATVSKVAADERGLGAHIIVVNLFNGFNPQADTKDGVHPNIHGEQKIAKKYFAVLKGLLKNM